MLAGPSPQAADICLRAADLTSRRWVLTRSPVTLPIPGTSTVQHLEENTAAAGIELTNQDFSELDTLGKRTWAAEQRAAEKGAQR